MLICLDVDYRERGAVAAGVLFDEWEAPSAVLDVVAPVDEVAPYVPGSFFLRELPCLQAVLHQVPAALSPKIECILVDGYVWLDGAGRKGLGAHLFEALGERIPVVGVAKTSFAGAAALPVLRGASKRPLWVTAAGVDAAGVVPRVAAMHGPHRIPTLLQRVDHLCRRSSRG